MSIAGDAKAHSTKDISTRHDCSTVILDIYNPSNTETDMMSRIGFGAI